MSEESSAAVERFFAAANARDAAGMAALFSDDAVVKDHARTHAGTAAVRAWAEQTVRLYDVTYTVTGTAAAGDAVRATVSVAGSFMGSPATLTYAFALRGGRIARLDIGF